MALASAYNYICVIDFEATCIDKLGKDFYPHEIIEFPAVLLDALKCEVISTFHSFIKPTINPRLTEFCKNLTGISQNSVNKSDTFECALFEFLKWINSILKPDETFVILTDGSWDMNKFLNLQCLISKIEFPSWAKQWIDIKHTFKHYKDGTEKVRLNDMLNTYGLTFDGKLHSGKDDAYNIAQLALTMMKSGCDLVVNSYYVSSSTKYLQRKLASYLREKRKNELRMQRRRNTKLENQFSFLNMRGGAMDIDPDLIGCESMLLEHKKY